MTFGILRLGLPTASALDNIGGNLGFLNPQRFQLLRSLLLSIHERPVSMDSRIFRGAIRKKYENIYDGKKSQTILFLLNFSRIRDPKSMYL